MVGKKGCSDKLSLPYLSNTTSVVTFYVHFRYILGTFYVHFGYWFLIIKETVQVNSFYLFHGTKVWAIVISIPA